jgi:hypothetical protein
MDRRRKTPPLAPVFHHMYLVFESDVLHRREHLARRIENLCNGRYQPVSISVPSYQLQQEMWDTKCEELEKDGLEL